MEIKLDDMCSWEQEKAIYLLKVAKNLGMDVDGYGQLAVNSNSGNTFLWLEDYNFCLYLPINCKLVKKDIVVNYSCPMDGEETEIQLGSRKLESLEKWGQLQVRKSDRK